jgi:cyclophilin family peptidyl-prolyl cis-trans isomerase/FKBP-type peptidyl-prolyl cis-trans isomerase
MKYIKKTMFFLSMALIFTTLSCQNKYPELGNGLFAEFATSNDTLVVELFYKKAPLTVANFVALTEGTHPNLADSLKGIPYYDGTIFHRVIDKFMIQGGDPTGTGSGSPGYSFGDEFDESLKHDKSGILSMANSGPATNGSQFFITEVPTPWLDNKHTIFGQVVKGLEVQDSISNVKVNPGNNKPIDDITILSLNIIAQGIESKRFNAAKSWEKELPLLEEKIEAAAALYLPLIESYKNKAITKDSGLLVYTITGGNGKKPKQGQTISLFYEGYFSDGKLFGTNVKKIDEDFGSFSIQKEQRGLYKPMPMLFSAEAQMIPGFKEGVFGMTIGEKAFFYLPSYLAYGESGRGPIKPNTDLVFIVEMLEK